MYKPFLTTALTLLLFTPLIQAEDELEWDFDFSAKKKSTISDFPLTEIGASDLSDAAISGALHTNVSGQGKAAHEEQKEQDQKRETSELESSDINQTNLEITQKSNIGSPIIPGIQADLPQQTVNWGNEIGGGFNSSSFGTNNNVYTERP